jgi:hypothetical protein
LKDKPLIDESRGNKNGENDKKDRKGVLNGE